MPFSIATREMLYAIKVIRPHLSTDRNLPMLTHVFVQFTGKELWFTATDRFTIGCYNVERADRNPGTGIDLPDVGGDPYEMYLSRFDLRMIEMLTRDAGRNSYVNFDAVPGLADAGWSLDFQHSRYRSELHMAYGSYPDLRGVLIKLSSPTLLRRPDRTALYDPAKVARFAGLTAPFQVQSPIRRTNGDPPSFNPALITADRFIGAIMPYNGPGIETVLPPERLAKP